LEVEVLNGEPGVYSARYAGEHQNADDNMNKLLTNLADKENRKAQFKTVICLNLNGNQHVFEGIVKGEIINEKRGSEGFGYDPIFIPNGYDKTFAEMPIAEKSKISHRGLAVEKLVAFLTKKILIIQFLQTPTNFHLLSIIPIRILQLIKIKH
jgi:XTP/dITP diphosphohydrolase